MKALRERIAVENLIFMGYKLREIFLYIDSEKLCAAGFLKKGIHVSQMALQWGISPKTVQATKTSLWIEIKKFTRTELS